MKKVLTGPGGLRLYLDSSKVDFDDPGADMPAWVELPFGRGSASFNCASEAGVVDSERYGETELTQAQVEWLCKQDEEVEKMFEAAKAIRDARVPLKVPDREARAREALAAEGGPTDSGSVIERMVQDFDAETRRQERLEDWARKVYDHDRDFDTPEE